MKEPICRHATPEAARLQKPMLTRLNRIEGQIRGVKRMIEADAYCDDIIHQISASRAALREVQNLLLDNHIRHCVKEQLSHGEDDVVEELVKTVRVMTR